MLPRQKTKDLHVRYVSFIQGSFAELMIIHNESLSSALKVNKKEVPLLIACQILLMVYIPPSSVVISSLDTILMYTCMRE